MRRGFLSLIVLALAALGASCAGTPPQPEATSPDGAAVAIEDQPESVKGAYEQEKDKARADYAAAKDTCGQQDEEPRDVCEEKAQADYKARLTVARSRYDSDRRKAPN